MQSGSSMPRPKKVEQCQNSQQLRPPAACCTAGSAAYPTARMACGCLSFWDAPKEQERGFPSGSSKPPKNAKRGTLRDHVPVAVRPLRSEGSVSRVAGFGPPACSRARAPAQCGDSGSSGLARPRQAQRSAAPTPARDLFWAEAASAALAGAGTPLGPVAPDLKRAPLASEGWFVSRPLFWAVCSSRAHSLTTVGVPRPRRSHSP